MFGHIMLAHFFVKWLISKLEQVEKEGKKKKQNKKKTKKEFLTTVRTHCKEPRMFHQYGIY